MKPLCFGLLRYLVLYALAACALASCHPPEPTHVFFVNVTWADVFSPSQKAVACKISAFVVAQCEVYRDLPPPDAYVTDVKKKEIDVKSYMADLIQARAEAAEKMSAYQSVCLNKAMTYEQANWRLLCTRNAQNCKKLHECLKYPKGNSDRERRVKYQFIFEK